MASTSNGHPPDFTIVEVPNPHLPFSWGVVRQNEHVVTGIEIMPQRFSTAEEARGFVRKIEQEMAQDA